MKSRKHLYRTTTMVAISLYRGNLHKPPDKTRRWIMPRFSIPPKEFCALHCRRSKALSLLPSSSVSPSPTPTLATPVANPNLNHIKSDQSNQPKTKSEENPNSLLKPSTSKSVVHGDSNPLDQPSILVDEGNKAPEEVTRKEVENIAIVDPIAPAIEGNDKRDEKEKRTKEVEEKLHILNERKHNLVQLLKLILNAEEELKRQSSLQAGKPPLPLQVDASNDSGSMTRHATPRNGSEANLTVDMMDIVGDDALNTNPQPRQLLRMSSTSPSAESVLKKPPYFQHNVAPHPSRAVLAAGSPSRFAPSGNQAHPPNVTPVSISGTNYVASSPSPAASGGTSVFRDARHPSPWN